MKKILIIFLLFIKSIFSSEINPNYMYIVFNQENTNSITIHNNIEKSELTFKWSPSEKFKKYINDKFKFDFFFIDARVNIVEEYKI